MRADFVFRVRLIAGAVILIALVLVFRLYDLQIAHGVQYRDRAEGQYVGGSGFDRGKILFTDKNGTEVGAATLATGALIAVVPPEIQDPQATYDELATYISLDEATFLAKAGKTGDPYEEVARRVSEEAADAIRTADIPGVRVFPEKWRFYQDGAGAAHAVGIIGYGGGDTLTGQYGIERFYNDVLMRGEDGLSNNFFAGLFADVRSRLFSDETRAGGNVVTSIEPIVQGFMEELLDRYGSEWHPQAAGAIVLDPSTGAVIAMSARPTFDPNDLSTANASILANPLVENVYEFGSIMKPLTMAAGLDAGVVTPESRYNDQGFATYDELTIRNFDGKARGTGTPMQQILSESLNTGAAHIAVEKLGPDRFRSYFKKFQLDEVTGIDLPNEAEPLVENLESPRKIEYATASFGQGFAVTPIAMARALAILANHGVVPSPHVATALEYPGEFSKPLSVRKTEVALSPQSTEQVTRMLVEVVDTALRGGAAKVPELSVAAKTGTAQIANPSERGYYTDRYLHSFFGYFPAYDPQFLVFFYAVAPQGARYASETWTGYFMDSVEFLMTYYAIEPDRAPTER